MLHEWRFALRSVVERRASTAAILLTLTLAIGANSAIFSAVDAVLLKPLPYPGSDRLVALFEAKVSDNDLTNLVAPVRLEEWNRMSRAFEGIAGSYFENATDTTGPLPERVAAMRTSPRFFSVMATPAALGRTFTPDEERFGGPAVVVISDAFWRTRLNADTSIVGRSLTLGGVNRTVVGVMPPSFRYPTVWAEAWIPAQMAAGLLSARKARFYTAVGRLKPGVTVEQARDDLNAIQSRLGEQFPDSDKGWGANVMLLKEQQIRGIRQSLWLLFGAVLLVLVAACGNIACLLLAQALRRQHEVAVRFALGATRSVIVRQLLREGAILAAVGSIGGLVLAQWATHALREAVGNDWRAADLHIDLRIVAFALILGGLTTLMFALAPALQTTKSEVAASLAHGTRGQVGGGQWLQRMLVTAQVSLAIVLLVGAGLLIRSFSRLQQVSPGFNAEGVLTFRMSATWAERPDAVANRQLRTLQRLNAIPGVVAASINTVLPAGGDFPPQELKIIGRETSERYFSLSRGVSAEYFKTLDIPLLEGQTCRDDPRAERHATALVSRAFADKFFPGESPIGHHVVMSFRAEIIGVVGDARERSLNQAPEPIAYACGLMPYWPDPYFIVRTDSSRGVTMAAVRDALREIEPQRAVYDAAPLTERLSKSLSQPRFNTLLLALFAGMALMLAAIGLYGMLAQFVTQRRREIGLRLALGAPRARVLAQLLGHGAIVIGAGTAIGMVAALAVARLMSTLMFGISSHDPVTFITVPVVLGTIAAAAAIVPARRAVRVDPMVALRES